MSENKPSLQLAEFATGMFRRHSSSVEATEVISVGNTECIDTGDEVICIMVDDGNFFLQFEYEISDPERLYRGSFIDKHTEKRTYVDYEKHASFITYMLKSIESE